MQTKVGLFLAPPAAAASSPAVDFFAAPEQVVAPEMKPAESNIQSVDPFAAVPINNVDNSDFFGSFCSHTGSASSAEPTAQSFMDSGNSLYNQNQKTSVAYLHHQKRMGSKSNLEFGLIPMHLIVV